MNVPPLSSSVTTALDRGFAQLNNAAAELASPADLQPPTDSVQMTSGMMDPMIKGVTDLMMAREQVEAGTLLLHQYAEDRRNLVDLLS